MSCKLVRADYKPRQTIADRQVLSHWKELAVNEFNAAEHERRALKAEYIGGYVLGFATGAGFAVVIIALLLWWSPLGGIAQ